MQELIDQFKEFASRIVFKDIRFQNWYGIGDKYQAKFPSEMELLRTKILTKIKPNSKEYRKWQFVFDDIFPPLNRIHYQTGLPEQLKGIGLGYKLYKALIYHLGWGCSEQNATLEAQKVWMKLFQDPDIMCFKGLNNEFLAISPNVDKDTKKSVLNQWQEFYKIQLPINNFQSDKEIVEYSVNGEYYRNTSQQWLINLLNDGVVRSQGKNFISLSLKPDSGGHDIFGETHIVFNSEAVDRQGAIEIDYEDPDFWEWNSNITKHVTGYTSANDYYENHGYENEADFEANGQDDTDTLSWMSYIDGYINEQEVVVEQLMYNDRLIKKVVINEEPKEELISLLKSHNIQFEINKKGDE